MVTTAINRSETGLGRANRKVIVAAVAFAIVGALTLLLAITMLTYRDTPRIGEPGKIDQAEGVKPKYPPAAPADPPSREPP